MELSTKIEFHVCNSLRENISYIKTASGIRNNNDIEFQNVEMHLLLESGSKGRTSKHFVKVLSRFGPSEYEKYNSHSKLKIEFE